MNKEQILQQTLVTLQNLQKGLKQFLSEDNTENMFKIRLLLQDTIKKITKEFNG